MFQDKFFVNNPRELREKLLSEVLNKEQNWKSLTESINNTIGECHRGREQSNKQLRSEANDVQEHCIELHWYYSLDGLTLKNLFRRNLKCRSCMLFSWLHYCNNQYQHVKCKVTILYNCVWATNVLFNRYRT